VQEILKVIQESGFAQLEIGNYIMFIIAFVLTYLAITKEYEPLLLIPISFGIVIANFPLAELGSYEDGIIGLIYKMGIKTELLPPIIFLGVGVLTDFRPLLSRPITFLLGAAAQGGIFIAALGAAYIFGFSPKEAAAIGIIGGADGPTSIFLSSQIAPHLLGPIALAAYSYMSLVPIIQPPIMRFLTTKKERFIVMPKPKEVSRWAVLLFPMVTGAIASLAIPSSAPLIGMLMFGNLIRESGVTDRLKKTAGGPMIDIVTIFLGTAVGATMESSHFLNVETLAILGMGAVAFVVSTGSGILFAKFLNLFIQEGKKINPCIGAAGVSAVPMAARVVQKFVSEETDGLVNPLMEAMGPNVAGVIGSAVAAGIFLSFLG
jgi:carboxybiotin decarboxylase